MYSTASEQDRFDNKRIPRVIILLFLFLQTVINLIFVYAAVIHAQNVKLSTCPRSLISDFNEYDVLFQVWFQNKRSKERRLKQLTSMGRGPFFGSSRKMRGFPMNLSPGGMEDAPPGFPYFASADGKFEFGYGGPPFHHDFFAGHHPHQGGPMPFPGPGEFPSLTDSTTKALY